MPILLYTSLSQKHRSNRIKETTKILATKKNQLNNLSCVLRFGWDPWSIGAAFITDMCSVG